MLDAVSIVVGAVAACAVFVCGGCVTVRDLVNGTRK